MSTPTFLDTDPTRDQLLRAVTGNHQQMWLHGARLRGGEVRQENGATWIYTPGEPGEVVLSFPRMTGPKAGAQLDCLMEYCRSHRPLRHVGCWSLTPARPRDLGARLLARGFEWGWQPHWMWLDFRNMQGDHPTPTGLHVELVEEGPVTDGVGVPYHSPADAAHWEAERRAQPRHVWRFAARLDGQIVGRSCLFLTRGRLGIAGIYGCGVVPSARNQGIGKAVTLAACQFAQRLGARHALLNATGMGEPVYRRIGFTSMGHGQTWWLHSHVLEAAPPTELQVRFVEATGRGDVAALAELRRKLEPGMADAVLPCGSTPLQVAVTTSQPGAAEWLVEHGATLDIISAWDLGWKERVRQQLATAPELANLRSGAWQTTPLHTAAERGDTELARLVLDTNPDLGVQDSQFHSTPLGWARHLQRAEIVALIEQHQSQK